MKTYDFPKTGSISVAVFRVTLPAVVGIFFGFGGV